MPLTNTVRQAALSIDFLIIGAGIAGLACATALRRVGHRVTVLEKDHTLDNVSGGCRMPPNLSKILYHWGLEEEVRSIAIKSESISLLLYESGELLGTHHWDEEVLKETRGEFVFTHQSALRKLLYDTAVASGATVRLNAPVVSLDPTERVATLQSGEQLRADVIVGADGSSGLARQHVRRSEFQMTPGRLDMYSATVPRERIMQDPELAFLYDQEYVTMFNWFGNDHSVLGFPIGDGSEFAIYVYAPKGDDNSEGAGASTSRLDDVLATSEPRLQKLGRLASPPTCASVDEYPALEEWVHTGGRMVVMGEAAHPLPPGSVQSSALSIEDAAVLARIFSHLRAPSQVGSFLWAYQDLRQPRCGAVAAQEFGIVHLMTMPPGPAQRLRDAAMRGRRDRGRVLEADAGGGVDGCTGGGGALAGRGGALGEREGEGRGSGQGQGQPTQEWVEIKEVFGYDAEDEADDWWVKWGLLRERSMGVPVEGAYGVPVQVGFVSSLSSSSSSPPSSPPTTPSLSLSSSTPLPLPMPLPLSSSVST